MSSELEIRTKDDRTAFCPGERVVGVARWHLPAEVEQLNVNLLWYTQGKGTGDYRVVDTVAIEKPPVSGERQFEFTLPPGPYSYSGKLVSIVWAVELVGPNGRDAARQDLVVSLTGREVTGLPVNDEA